MLKIFVYGTLKPSEVAFARYCQPWVIESQMAYVKGRLFHLPQGYPALTEGDRWVQGALPTSVRRVKRWLQGAPTSL
ncbi:MAG: gamma-glutamylcyclotransferase [Leptolyngbyaceae cyanobacterium]